MKNVLQDRHEQQSMRGRVFEITDEGVAQEGDPRHKQLLEEHFGKGESVKPLTKRSYSGDQEQGAARQ